MMGAVTPETCRVTLQQNKSDCILLHLVGFLFNIIMMHGTMSLKFTELTSCKKSEKNCSLSENFIVTVFT